MSERVLARPWLPIALALMGAYAAAIALAPSHAMAIALAVPLAITPLAYWLVLARDHWLPLFFAAALLLPPLPFGLGNSGPHLALVFVLAGLLTGALRWAEWRAPAAPLHRALGIFLLILLGSSALAVFYSGPRVALGSLMRVMLFGISVYTFFYAAYGPGARQATDSFSQARQFYWIAVASALFACVDFYFQFPAPAGFGEQFIWLRSGVYRRAQGLFYEASTLGNFCAFFLAMIVAGLLARRGEAPVSRRGLVLGGMIFAAALVLSFSRGSLMNVLVATAVLVWMNRSRIRVGKLLFALPATLLAVATALLVVLPTFAGAYWMRVATSVQYLSQRRKDYYRGVSPVGERCSIFLPSIPGTRYSGWDTKPCLTPLTWGGRLLPTICISACWRKRASWAWARCCGSAWKSSAQQSGRRILPIRASASSEVGFSRFGRGKWCRC